MSDSSFIATGRRKTSVARVKMATGTGKITVNGKPFDEYFPTVSLQNRVLFPLQIADCINRWDINARTTGGGVSGQVDAIRLGITRALMQHDSELRPALKAKGLVRRDPRAKERKKAGQPGARKRFQFSKR